MAKLLADVEGRSVSLPQPRESEGSTAVVKEAEGRSSSFKRGRNISQK